MINFGENINVTKLFDRFLFCFQAQNKSNTVSGRMTTDTPMWQREGIIFNNELTERSSDFLYGRRVARTPTDRPAKLWPPG